MIRAAKPGDETYNARKRYTRQAERYLKQASQSAGEDAARKRALAKTAFENALALYDAKSNQRVSKPVAKLAAEFGIDLTQRDIKKSYISTDEQRRQRVTAESKSWRVGAQTDPEQRRQFEAVNLMRNPTVSRRFFAATQDIWREKAVKYDPELGANRIDPSKIYQVLFEHYGVDNLADLMDKVAADLGADNLYDVDIDDDELYAYLTAKGSYVYGQA